MPIVLMIMMMTFVFPTSYPDTLRTEIRQNRNKKKKVKYTNVYCFIEFPSRSLDFSLISLPFFCLFGLNRNNENAFVKNNKKQTTARCSRKFLLVWVSNSVVGLLCVK